LRGLDWIGLSMADVQMGVAAFVTIYYVCHFCSRGNDALKGEGMEND